MTDYYDDLRKQEFTLTQVPLTGNLSGLAAHLPRGARVLIGTGAPNERPQEGWLGVITDASHIASDGCYDVQPMSENDNNGEDALVPCGLVKAVVMNALRPAWARPAQHVRAAAAAWLVRAKTPGDQRAATGFVKTPQGWRPAAMFDEYIFHDVEVVAGPSREPGRAICGLGDRLSNCVASDDVLLLALRARAAGLG